MTTTSSKEEIHVITSIQRRRRWTNQEKTQIVKETYESGNSVSLLTREYNIAASQLFQWRRYMEEGANRGIEITHTLTI
ncbi:transposase [Leptospira kmetyi]|nr:transposase [Leptospira kmetyi]